MTQQISTWVARGTQELQALAPYALAAMSPGGSITSALGGAIIGGLLSLCRRGRQPDLHTQRSVGSAVAEAAAVSH
jgi:hypothetical protein